MVDVVMPDGTIIKNVPEGMTQSELLRRLDKAGRPLQAAEGHRIARVQTPDGRVMTLQVPEGASEDEILAFARQEFAKLSPAAETTAQADAPGPGRTFDDAVVNRIGQSLLNVPETALNAVAQFGSFSPAGMIGEALGVLPEGSRQPLGEPPQVDFGLDVTDVRAGIETAPALAGQLLQGETPNVGETFDEQRAMLERRFQGGREANPAAAIAGDLVGSGATIAAGRLPLARGLQRMRQRPAPTEPRADRDLFDRIADAGSKMAQRFRRAGGKAAEASVEGLVLGALEDDNPAARAGLMAGAQAGGSLAMFLVERPFKRLLPFVATATVAHQMFQAVAPGQRNVFEAFDFAIDKSIIAFAGGALASMAGMGRITGVRGQNMPLLADALTAVPRGAVNGLIGELRQGEREGDPTLDLVLGRFRTDPNFFTEAEQNRLGRAFTDGRRSARKEIERMMQNSPAFRRKIEELTR